MTEHVHEWAIIGKWANCVAQWNCAASLSPEEIERRINATERLSAGDARIVGIEIEQGTYDLRGLKADGFLAYADILEGKDG